MSQIKSPPVGVAGYVNICKVGKDGKVNFRTKFKNLILDQFFISSNTSTSYRAMHSDAIGDYAMLSSLNSNCFLSSDVQTPPQVTDTSMNNFIAGVHRRVSFENGYVQGASISEDYIFFSTTYRFDEDEANGQLTEVGIGPPSADGSTVVCKSLIKDEQGSPIVITKVQGETLFITYELRYYRPDDYISDPFTVVGNSGEFRLISTTLAGYNLSASEPFPRTSIRGIAHGTRDLFAEIGTNRVSSITILNATSNISEQTSAYHFSHYASPQDAGRVIVREAPPSAEDYQLNPVLYVLTRVGLLGGTTHTGPLVSRRINATQTFTNNNGAIFHGQLPETVSYVSSRVVAVIVDATTMEPRTLTIPAGYKFTLTTDGGTGMTRK